MVIEVDRIASLIPLNTACSATGLQSDVNILSRDHTSKKQHESRGKMTVGTGQIGVCAAGMGCSAGVIAVGLAQRLLAGEPNSRALVVSTENITLNWYSGNERSMLIPNTLFRMGGAGILLTNRPTDRWRAKYSLEHIVRVHLGRDDSAYR